MKRLLGAGRLVALAGPGGVGKTRLAERAMHGVARAFGDGVVFAGLAELRDAQLLANLVADRLGLQDLSGRTASEAVLHYLRERRVLLVLDNCEHLIDDCAKFTAELLAVCPRVVVLATSRQSLGVAGEHVHPVLPLSVSDDAVRLFVDRAKAVSPTFEATPDNADDVVQVCRQLDGLPLAIELAAAWIRSLSVQQIAERLSSRLSLLTSARRTVPERQRTLRDTVDWRYDLCSLSEQCVWARASVFAGSFDLEAAESVCSGPDVPADLVLGLVDGLLDKSVLLREEDGDQVRYRMLEPCAGTGRSGSRSELTWPGWRGCTATTSTG